MTSHDVAAALLAMPPFPMSRVPSPPKKPLPGQPVNPKKCPTKPFSLWVCKLYSRRTTTEWSDEEIAAYRKLTPPQPDEMAMIEAYYKAERAKGDGEKGGIWRRDILRFLRHFQGELDRARAHHEQSQRKLKRFEPKPDNVVQLPPQPVVPEELARQKFKEGVKLAL